MAQPTCSWEWGGERVFVDCSFEKEATAEERVRSQARRSLRTLLSLVHSWPPEKLHFWFSRSGKASLFWFSIWGRQHGVIFLTKMSFVSALPASPSLQKAGNNLNRSDDQIVNFERAIWFVEVRVWIVFVISIDCPRPPPIRNKISHQDQR